MGAWDLRGFEVFQPCPKVECWGIINFDPKVRANQIEEYFSRNRDGYVAIANKSGVQMSEKPAIVKMASHCQPESDDIKTVIQACIHEVEQGSKRKLQIIVCLLQDKTTKFYQTVKLVTDGLIGIRCQCMVCAMARDLCSFLFFSSCTLSKIMTALTGARTLHSLTCFFVLGFGLHNGWDSNRSG